MSEQSREKRLSVGKTDTGSELSASVVRIKSEDLFRQMREVEIEHQGRIYRLRLTQLNKLILTA
ncbi:MAG TPA: hemin uptake protein HemP [Noviherbaspirillum sp.]|nr:hemin uptake protein HemP [Noviherbaspirillum sp.]HEV2611781.1 hemin uptake protein HemP [Noviherbaspirillum sp.]